MCQTHFTYIKNYTKKKTMTNCHGSYVIVSVLLF